MEHFSASGAYLLGFHFLGKDSSSFFYDFFRTFYNFYDFFQDILVVQVVGVENTK